MTEADGPSYFQAIEETFIRLRGAPLLLSPEDWRIARGWEEQGVPLSLVRRTLEELFEQRRQRGDERRIHSLRYCARAVEGAWKGAVTLAATGIRDPVAALDLGGRLNRLADSLPDRFVRIAERIRELEGAPEEVEGKLERLDLELVADVVAGLAPVERSSLEAEARAGVTELVDRLPEAEIEGAVDSLRRQAVRQRASLPVLSLFSREARRE